MNQAEILTQLQQKTYMIFFFKLRDQFGQTFVLVTHNQELAAMADRTLTMKDGVIV